MNSFFISSIMNNLPFELIVLIARNNPNTWHCLCQAVPILGRYSINETVKEEIRQRFLQETINTEYKILYLLPNGAKHNFELPSISTNGDMYWYYNNELHRKNLPAVIWADGSRHWYCNGELHREDQPAIIRLNGTHEYWINGVKQNE